MKTSRFDMAEGRREVLRLSAQKACAASAKWADLKERVFQALAACDRSKEEDRADHGALLLFLCAIEDFEKRHSCATAEESERLLIHATRKLRSARLQYENSA